MICTQELFRIGTHFNKISILPISIKILQYLISDEITIYATIAFIYFFFTLPSSSQLQVSFKVKSCLLFIISLNRYLLILLPSLYLLYVQSYCPEYFLKMYFFPTLYLTRALRGTLLLAEYMTCTHSGHIYWFRKGT